MGKEIKATNSCLRTNFPCISQFSIINLFHFNPSIVVSVESPPNCCLAYVSSSFPAEGSPLTSSSLTFEFHLCNLNEASSKISTVFSFRSSACGMVYPPVSKSSTYKLLRSSATILGYLSSHELRCCSITPAGEMARVQTQITLS
jgi:hypothetical protein